MRISKAQMLTSADEVFKYFNLLNELAEEAVIWFANMEQVNGAIQQLNQMIQENAAASEEMASSSEELLGQAEQMKEVDSFFSIETNRALLAPGNKHTLLIRSGARYYVEVTEGPLVNRHRTSVDVLFRSVAMNAGAYAVGVIMTGKGGDGAKGLLEMKNAGAHTIAQNEQSCVVFGMPHDAIKLEAHTQILSLEWIAAAALKKSHK